MAFTQTSLDRTKDATFLPTVSRRVQGRLNSLIYPGEMILGIQTVETMNVVVEEWNDERFDDVAAEHSPGARINTVSFTKKFANFDLGFWALDATETDEFMTKSASSANAGVKLLRNRYAMFAAGFIRRQQEVRRAALLRDPANYGSNTIDLTGLEWGAGGNRILTDVIAGADAIHTGTGAADSEMSLFLPRAVWREARFDVGFVAFLSSGGKQQVSGLGTIDQMTEYLGFNTWTDDRGLEVALTRGAAPTKVWPNDALLYVDHARVPNAGDEDWGFPTFGRVYRNSFRRLGATTPWIDRHHDVWHFPWKDEERSFIQKAAAGFLFEDAVAP